MMMIIKMTAMIMVMLIMVMMIMRIIFIMIIMMMMTFQSYLGNEVTGGIVAWLGSGIFAAQ